MTDIAERTLDPQVAESWIRECLSLHPEGVELTVTGACMEPVISEGAKICLGVPKRDLRVGDIVLLRTASGLRLHRILVRFGRYIRTKGDQGAYLDPPSNPQAVIAAFRSRESWTLRAARVALSLSRLLLRRPGWSREEALRLR